MRLCVAEKARYVVACEVAARKRLVACGASHLIMKNKSTSGGMRARVPFTVLRVYKRKLCVHIFNTHRVFL